MAATIEHRAEWDAPAATVYATLTAADYLSARLTELGGRDAAIVERTVDEHGARLRLRHSVAVDLLPAIVRSVIGGDVLLDRVETWSRRPEGGWDGTVEVTMRGLGGSLSGTQSLADTGQGSSATLISGAAHVPLPLLGGRIENVARERVLSLLESEDEFTRRWLANSA